MTKQDKPAAEVVPMRRTRACPICGQPSQRPVFPFCSKRCADIDLHRWLSGSYAIPAADGDEDDTLDPA
ncbi:DNA gyrase inhibitor YacG [Bauldia sp.]|uniref:DNA gyrase inhibitor YacG n=1 Tax=Bauldia sp. TaxID=2575872 RepID=UPI003BABEC9E